MTPRDRAALSVFLIGATASVVWAYFRAQSVLAMFLGTSGLGAFPSDMSALLRGLLAVSVVSVLAAFARRRGSSKAIVLQKAHRYGSLAMVVTIALPFAGVFTEGLSNAFHYIEFGLFIAALLAGGLWMPWQAFCSAGFLSLLIKTRP
jgi:hypothetical protein